jgi:hypothetical protein
MPVGRALELQQIVFGRPAFERLGTDENSGRSGEFQHFLQHFTTSGHHAH